MSITGIPVKDLTPGSPEWLQTISASKIPAILGISPWESRFSLWQRMAGNISDQEETTTTRRGHYLEPAVAAWFADQHPELHVETCGSFAHPEHPEWTAAPDRIAGEHGVEIKSVAYADEWGREGTAEIPPYYLAQVAWQMHVTGIRKIYVPIITGMLVFKEYVVEWDDIAADLPIIIAEVEAFQASLAAGTPPELDGSDATYTAIRKLHPGIDGELIELDDEMALNYIAAKYQLDAAQAEHDLHKNTIGNRMGTAKKAAWHGIPIFTRQARGTGTPYLVAAKNLPALNTLEKAS
jgi:putative phage-type endonuclease